MSAGRRSLALLPPKRRRLFLLTAWLAIANTRTVCTVKAAPVGRLATDVAAMLPLPRVPLHLGWRNRIRLGREAYVRLDTSDNSVDPHAIGRLVDVTADLDRVKVRLNGKVVADHARVWARGMTITDPGHVAAAKVLWKHFKAPRPAAIDDLARDVGDYDRAFGIGSQAM